MVSHICSSVVITIIGLLLHVYVVKSSKEKCISYLITMILFTIIAGFIISAKENMQYAEKVQWNSGYCATCQEPWKFSNANRVGATTHYYYFCDNCGKVIELTQQFPIDN